jgi:hypothetical protein
MRVPFKLNRKDRVQQKGDTGRERQEPATDRAQEAVKHLSSSGPLTADPEGFLKPLPPVVTSPTHNRNNRAAHR